MLVKELPLQSLPFLNITDSVEAALRLMGDSGAAHLPVISNNVYTGIVGEDELMQIENALLPISEAIHFGPPTVVKEEDYFLKAVQLAAAFQLSIVPVVSDDLILLGVVSYSDLLKGIAHFMSLGEPGAMLVLEINPHQYSLQEINRLVESNDAQITQLNTTHDNLSGMLLVTLRINKSEVSDILSTFQRYDYVVKYYFGEEIYVNDLRSNYDNLMNYLKL